MRKRVRNGLRGWEKEEKGNGERQKKIYKQLFKFFFGQNNYFTLKQKFKEFTLVYYRFKYKIKKRKEKERELIVEDKEINKIK